MRRRLLTSIGVWSIVYASLAAGAAAQAPAPRTAAPVRPEDLPARKRLPVPKGLKGWTPSRTAWGDPEIAGVFTSQQPFEYACHEGNYGLRNILAAARAEEKAANH